MTRQYRTFWLMIGLIFLIGIMTDVTTLSPPAHAQAEQIITADALLGTEAQKADKETSAGKTDAPSDTPSINNTMIESNPALVNDKEVAERIRSIFAEVEGLSAVTVSVNEGVVKLSGETANEKKATQAINLASRVSNVVTVEDNISRTLDVQENITPVLNGLYDKTKGWLKATPLLLIAILAFGLVTGFGGWLSRRETLWQRITPNPFVAELFAQTTKVIFIVMGLILALSLMGAETIISTLLGGAGVIGIAVGFAVKDTIENYISSLMLSLRQPFRARDQVVINGMEGIVVRLTSRATILMTLDGNHLRIPNAEVFKGTILNYTKNPERRFTFELGVDANDDPLAAIKVGLDAINELDFVLDEPKAIAVINEVGDSNIVLQFQVWVNQTQTDFLKARSIAIREAKHALENFGFSLPEPIYMVNFDQGVEDAIIQIGQKFGLAKKIKPKHHPTLAEVEQLDNQNHGKQWASNAVIYPSNDAVLQPNTEGDAGIDIAEINAMSDEQLEKLAAKARAKRVLSGQDVRDILNAKPDRKLMEKVEDEIQRCDGDADLLNNDSPQE